MAKKKEKLPKTIYVFRQTNKDGESWLVPEEDLEGCAEIHKGHLVGIYDLQKMVRVSTNIKTEPV